MIPGPVFASAPQRVYWEITRACDLACRHCRAEAAPDPDRDELSTAEIAGVLLDAGAPWTRTAAVTEGTLPPREFRSVATLLTLTLSLTIV